MASTIRIPVRGSRMSVQKRLLPYLLGSVLSAVALALVLTEIGRLASLIWLDRWEPILIAALIVLAGITAFQPYTSTRWPELRRQVPRQWVQPPTSPGLFLSGLYLGAGVFSFIRYSVFYLILLITIALSSQAIQVSSLPMLAYGLASGLTPVFIDGSFETLSKPISQIWHDRVLLLGRVVSLFLFGTLLLLSLSEIVATAV